LQRVIVWTRYGRHGGKEGRAMLNEGERQEMVRLSKEAQWISANYVPCHICNFSGVFNEM
jgi:hypothetical protein